MTQQTRTILKGYFNTGDTPSETQFSNLIDSNFNPSDDTMDAIPDGTTNKLYTATEKTKLSGIETGADVTDATNVAAAGAVMSVAGLEPALGNPASDGLYLKSQMNGTRSWGAAGGAYVRGATKVIASNTSIDKVNVDYVCDGTADDVQIQAAIDALGTLGGKIILLEGTYNCAADIVMDDRVEISGMGIDATTIDFGNGAYQIIATSKTDVSLKDMTCTKSADTDGVAYMNTVTRLFIDRVKFSAGTTTNNVGLKTNALVDFSIEKSVFTGFSTATGYGLIIKATNPDGGSVTDCVFDGNYRGAYSDSAGRTVFSRCLFKNVSSGGYGFRVGHYTRIIECHFHCDLNNRVGIQVDGRDGFEISSCHFLSYNDNYAITFGAGGDSHGIITNNVFEGGGILRLNYDLNGVLVVNNKFRDGSQIQFDGNNEGCYVDNNIAFDYPNAYTTLFSMVDRSVTHGGLNTSGGALTLGTVVVRKVSVAAGNEFTTTTTAGDKNVLGIVASNGVSNTFQSIILTEGRTNNLKVDGTTDIAIGDYISCHTVAGVGKKATTGETAFAIAREAYTTNDSNGVIDATLIPPRMI